MSKWTRIRNELVDILASIRTYNDFYDAIKDLTSQQKGDYFEYYAKAYFTLLPEWRTQIKDYILYDEIPEELMEQLNLPATDKGIDGLLIWKDGTFSAVQVKFRKDREVIPFGEIATFPGLTFGSYVTGFASGILFTNCIDACAELKNDKYLIINEESLKRCDRDFWSNFRSMVRNDKVEYTQKRPREYQKRILKTAQQYYTIMNNGRLYMPCGTGKSLMGVWIAQTVEAKKIFLCVPSLYLLSETFETWARDFVNNDQKSIDFLLIGSDVDREKEDIREFKLTTNKEDIKAKLQTSSDYLVVITTYQSSDMLIQSAKELNLVFDFGIFDEAHRTTGAAGHTFTKLVGAPEIVKKRLFMTATERIYHSSASSSTDSDSDDMIYTMDDPDVYGDIIYHYSTRMAINDRQLVDYRIVASFITNSEFATLLDKHQIVNALAKMYDINLLFTCLMIIQSMKTFKFEHLLIFSNTNQKAKDVMDALQIMINNDPELKDIYTQRLTGESSMTRRRRVVSRFEQSERGIISSAKIFGEGVNIKACDAVCFVDNKSSTVDVQQYVGRCLRLYESKPNKISYVLVPFVLNSESDSESGSDLLDSDKADYHKIRSILKAMGQTDEMIQDTFVLKRYGDIVRHSATRKSDEKEIIGKDIVLDAMKDSILVKTLDRMGDPIDRTRQMLNEENKLRFANCQPLLIEPTDCQNFLKDYAALEGEQLGELQNRESCKNWFRFCVGNRLYDVLKKMYYYDLDDFRNACEEIGIASAADYQKRYFKDDMLPPISYIDSGFYQDLDQSFNISEILGSPVWSIY